jgi:Uma2 family endonuclease
MARNGRRFGYVAELLDHLGVPPERICLDPYPGEATERDLLERVERDGRLCELIDGVLVEKPMGADESALAARLGGLLFPFVEDHDAGELVGADGPFRLMPGLVRLPDLSFLSRERLPGGLPLGRVATVVPDLAVEVLSDSNTTQEIDQKLKEYFFHGVRVVWVIDPPPRTVRVYTAVDESTLLTEDQTLDGGDVLPGFTLPLSRLFAKVRLPRPKPPRRKRPS